MANSNLLLLILIIVVAFVLYYYVFKGQLTGACGICSICGAAAANGQCPTCLLSQDAMEALQQMARGCSYRLRGVVREDMATATDVGAFMTDGNNRLVIVTNVVPEDFIAMIESGEQPALDQLKAVAMSSALVNGTKNYVVMSVSGGSMSAVGTPTTDFTTAFGNLESTASAQVGADVNNLVFFIDEDIPCPDEEVTPIVEEIPEEVMMPLPAPEIMEFPEELGGETENCCGRRY